MVVDVTRESLSLLKIEKKVNGGLKITFLKNYFTVSLTEKYMYTVELFSSARLNENSVVQ